MFIMRCISSPALIYLLSGSSYFLTAFIQLHLPTPTTTAPHLWQAQICPFFCECVCLLRCDEPAMSVPDTAFPLLIRTPVTEFRACSESRVISFQDPQLHLQRPSFRISPHSEVLGGYKFWGGTLCNPLPCVSYCRKWTKEETMLLWWRRECNPLQHSCLENPVDWEAWLRSQTRLSNTHTRTHTHAHTRAHTLTCTSTRTYKTGN